MSEPDLETLAPVQSVLQANGVAGTARPALVWFRSLSLTLAGAGGMAKWSAQRPACDQNHSGG